jgi:methylisocitrate lyase
MDHQNRKAEQFRGLHIPGKPLVLFNIWDACSAKSVGAAGAKALATGSWSVANANGFADGERIPLALAIDNLRRIVGATELPVTVDLESGYGDPSEAVGETIVLAIDAGAVGCNLEDSFPADGKLRTISDQADRIRRARQTADAAKIHFFINARTDIFTSGAARTARRCYGDGGDGASTRVCRSWRRWTVRARSSGYHPDRAPG